MDLNPIVQKNHDRWIVLRIFASEREKNELN